MVRTTIAAVTAALVLSSLSSSPARLSAQEQKPDRSVTYSMTIPIKDLIVYRIEVKSTKPVSLRLGSPKSIETARVRKMGAPSATRQQDGSTMYFSKLEHGLSSPDLAGDWTLDIIFSDGTPVDEMYTLSITPIVTR